MSEFRPEAGPLLKVQGLKAWYGESQVLHDINFEVNTGELVTLIGRNGVGKTTTLRALMGLMDRREGSVTFRGCETIRLNTRAIAALGMALCPEERAIFGSLTVAENLALPPRVADGGLSAQEVFELFPRLKERLNNGGHELSGGEQQMLAIARILHTGACLLLLDEPTEGLAPVIVQHIANAIRHLKERGFTILLVEQNLRFAMKLADRHYVIEHGHTVDAISSDDSRYSLETMQAWLAV